MSEQRHAVVLLSGGLDSTTVLAIARNLGFACHTLSVDYGQRHRRELELAREQAQRLGACEHREIRVDLRAIGGSALTAAIDVPRDRLENEIANHIPITYVPARNTIFLSLCLGVAEVVGAFDLFIGANAVDYSGYPDCRPEFLAAFEALANKATKAAVEGQGIYRVHAPLLYLKKAEIIRRGIELGVDYALTHSCYAPDPAGHPCEHCDSCRIRARGFAEAGMNDPVLQA